MHGRAVAPAVATAPEGERRGETLHRNDTSPDEPTVMVGLDGRVASTARGLGRKPGGEEPACQRAERRNEGQDDRVEGSLGASAQERLASCAKRLEARDAAEQEALAEFEDREEGGPDDPGGDPDRTCV